MKTSKRIITLLLCLTLLLVPQPKSHATDLIAISVSVLVIGGVVFCVCRQWGKKHLSSSSTTDDFNVPQVGGTVNVGIQATNTFYMGENVVVAGPAHFTITAIYTTSLNLKFLGATNDVPVGTLIKSGATIQPGATNTMTTYSMTYCAPGANYEYSWSISSPGGYSYIWWSNNIPIFGAGTSGNVAPQPLAFPVCDTAPIQGLSSSSITDTLAASDPAFTLQYGFDDNNQPWIGNGTNYTATPEIVSVTGSNSVTFLFPGGTLNYILGPGTADYGIWYEQDIYPPCFVGTSQTNDTDGDTIIITQNSTNGIPVPPAMTQTMIVQRTTDFVAWTPIFTNQVYVAQPTTITDTKLYQRAFYRAAIAGN